MTISEIIKVARPKTLAASASPVILASALAYSDGVFRLLPAILSLAVALFAQIASNFANDYFDFKNGMDGDGRMGPERVVAAGKVEARQVLVGALVFVSLSCLCGLGLLFFAPWWIILVGMAMAICVFGYSAGPFPLSHHALGDVAVLVFYGLVPVCFTYFVQAGTFSLESLWYAFAIGLLSVNILIVNNYRDVAQDKATGKKTTIVLFGRKVGSAVYLINIVIAVVIPTVVIPAAINPTILNICLMAILYAILFPTWLKLRKQDGPALNPVLGETARNVLLYSIFSTVTLIIALQ